MNRPPFQVSARPQSRGRGASAHDNFSGYPEHRWPDEHRFQSDYGNYGGRGNHDEYHSYIKHGSYSVHYNQREGRTRGEHEIRSEERVGRDEAYELEKFEISDPPNESWEARTPGWWEWMVMSTVALTMFIAALDSTILIPALPTISEALKGSLRKALWTAISYLLATAAFQPLLSSLSHIFGRPKILLCSLLLFTAGTVVAAVSRNFTLLIVGRSIQGIGGAGIMVLDQVIFTDTIPLSQRENCKTLIHMAWMLGWAVGPMVGGLITQKTHWWWIFWSRLPLLGAGLVMTAVWVKFDAEAESWRQKVWRIDWVGTAVFIPSITGFLFGITWGGDNHPWSCWQTIVPIVLGIVGLAATFIYEKWGASDPFMKPFAFSQRSTSAALAAAFIQGLVLYSILYYIPFYLQSTKGFNPAMGGLGLLPITFALVPSSIVVGIIMSRTSKYLWSLWAGWAAAILGTALLLFLDVNTEPFNWIFIFLVLGIGQGMLLTPINFAAQAACDPKDAAFSSAMLTFIRSLGIAVGVALGGVIFHNKLYSNLLSLLGTQSEISPEPIRNITLDEIKNITRHASAYVIELSRMESGSYKDHILEAYAGSFATVFQFLAGITLLGGVISLLIGSRPKDKPSDNSPSELIKGDGKA